MKKKSILSYRKSHPLILETGDENESRVSAVIDERFSKTSKYLPKTDVDYFHLRKPLNIYMTEELKAINRKTYFQRVYVMGTNIDNNKLKEYCDDFGLKKTDICLYFQRIVDDIFPNCERIKTTADHLRGIFIAMGEEHSLLMIEGSEDMVSTFFEELSSLHNRVWEKSKVFLVEDKIAETYLYHFYHRHSPAINVNEKFPVSTSNDASLMSVQHIKIKEKINSLAAALSTYLKRYSTPTSRLHSNEPVTLPADPFNKLLPEIQRIELVLNADKFYRGVKAFSDTYRVLQIHQDEDSFLWPIQNNYTPLDIFERSLFDVNLTFGNYGLEEKKEERDSHDIEDDSQSN